MAKAKGVSSTPRINSPAIPEKDSPAQAIVSCQTKPGNAHGADCRVVARTHSDDLEGCAWLGSPFPMPYAGDMRRTVIDR
jgi:hypothetical protein